MLKIYFVLQNIQDMILKLKVILQYLLKIWIFIVILNLGLFQ